jgi:hypothetical protein
VLILLGIIKQESVGRMFWGPLKSWNPVWQSSNCPVLLEQLERQVYQGMGKARSYSKCGELWG